MGIDIYITERLHNIILTAVFAFIVVSFADSLDLPAYALKRLLNHKMNNAVTAGYIMKDVERLRKPMQQVANFIHQHMMFSQDE